MLASTAQADWSGAAAGGADYELNPKIQGHGWLLFDALGQDAIGKGDLRLNYNTETLHIAIERLPMGTDKVEFNLAVRGELILAGILPDYYKQGARIGGFGFNASYVQLIPKWQWHFANNQTLEAELGVRRWFFGRKGGTAAAVVLPPDAWVFEPRIGYIFWKVRSSAEEWQAHRIFPRIEGTAFGVNGALDVRSNTRGWGSGDGRNTPDDLIWGVYQWLRAGWQVSTPVRIQLAEWGAWGWGQDDLTRYRIGGMNPYVIPVPGLPWPALLSERLLMGQLALHLRPSKKAAHELGLYVAGGALNDVKRTGDLNSFGGVGGLALFGDLRFGRVQVDVRLGWAFPVSWLVGGPYLSALGTVGVELF